METARPAQSPRHLGPLSALWPRDFSEWLHPVQTHLTLKHNLQHFIRLFTNLHTVYMKKYLHDVSFHLYGVSKIGKSEAESR